MVSTLKTKGYAQSKTIIGAAVVLGIQFLVGNGILDENLVVNLAEALGWLLAIAGGRDALNGNLSGLYRAR